MTLYYCDVIDCSHNRWKWLIFAMLLFVRYLFIVVAYLQCIASAALWRHTDHLDRKKHCENQSFSAVITASVTSHYKTARSLSIVQFPSLSKHFCLVIRPCVFSTLEIFLLMCYINLRFTYLLTYLLRINERDAYVTSSSGVCNV